MAEYEHVSKLMAIMSANYSNYRLTKEAVALYARVLQDIPGDVLEAAALDICSKPGAFFPSAGDWRSAALDILQHKSGIPLAIEAWEEARREVGRCGEYWLYQQGQRLPEYSHPLIEKTVAAIGYRNILEPDNEEVLRAQFIKAYEALRGRNDESLRMLPEVKVVEQKYLENGTAMKQLAEGMKRE